MLMLLHDSIEAVFMLLSLAAWVLHGQCLRPHLLAACARAASGGYILCLYIYLWTSGFSVKTPPYFLL